MVAILSAVTMVMIITTITMNIFNFILAWRWIKDSSQAILLVTSHFYPHFDQTKQFVIASHVLRWWNMSYVTSFLATSKQHLIIISRRLHQFFDTFFIAPVIRISDDDHHPRKCFAHIHHSLLDLESLTFDFERLDVEIFIVLIYTIMICAHVTICIIYCVCWWR